MNFNSEYFIFWFVSSHFRFGNVAELHLIGVRRLQLRLVCQTIKINIELKLDSVATWKQRPV